MPAPHDYKPIPLPRLSFAVITLLPLLSLGACASEPLAAAPQAPEASIGSSQNDPTSTFCLKSISALQEAGYGERSGHLDALKTLERCYTQLGQTDKAKRIHWRISRELNRSNPHDW